MKNGLALGAGLIFGVGLYIAMMTDPNKVLAFLDLAGRWDPSLALVMGGAVAVAAAGFALSRGLERSWTGAEFAWPGVSRVDTRLMAGAALFGVGWGMTGYCPGPGIAALSINPAEAVPYLLAMAAGMVLWDRWLAAESGTP